MADKHRLSEVTDTEVLAALRPEFQFTYEVVRGIYGRQIKSKVPHIRAKLRRLAQEGGVLCTEQVIPGQERWAKEIDSGF
jgi:hypothetical protein